MTSRQTSFINTLLDHIFPKVLVRASGIAALSALVLATVSPQPASAATAVIYCNGNMGTPNGLTTSQINGLRSSGFTNMVIFTMTVQSNGDFTYGGFTLCRDGNYVGPSNYGSLLNQCKTLPSSIYQIEMAIGGANDPSFQNIKNIINAQGNNTGNILYRNLSALHGNLPIDAVNFDDESVYDVSSAVTFGGMAGSLGMKVTLCPYTNPNFWKDVKNGLGGYCQAIYLQCYEGGVNNNPATWNTYFGGMRVMPGYWDWERNATFQNKMLAWRNAGTNGGFYWPSNTGGNPPAGPGDMQQYSDWIHTSLDNQPSAVCIVVNRGSRHVLDASGAGTASGTPIIQSVFHGGNNQRWDNRFENGQLRFIGMASGRAVTLKGYEFGENVPTELWDWFGGNHQKFTVNYRGSGFYNIVFVHSGKAMEAENNSTASGARVVQYTLHAHGYSAQWSFRNP
jgi:hypothetical protein